jgi:AGZA family xanthine/uracil permease-like MFS transporter
MIGGGTETADGARLLPLTAPALIVVGSLIARNVRQIDWSDSTESFPAFLILIGIPFTNSIADGIAFGFIAYPLLKLLSGRAREASPLVYALGLLFVMRYALL